SHGSLRAASSPRGAAHPHRVTHGTPFQPQCNIAANRAIWGGVCHSAPGHHGGGVIGRRHVSCDLPGGRLADPSLRWSVTSGVRRCSDFARSPLAVASAKPGTLRFRSAMAPHVLVADDDAWILRMVATVLEKRGYSVETAVDGEDALHRALARTPDLLITDVMMPRMDGWSLVRNLRAHSALALLPVIFLTALSSEDDRIRGFRLGADDYVTKPFRFEELDLRVAKTLRRTQASVQEAREHLVGAGLRGD